MKALDLTVYEMDEDGDYIHPDGYFISSLDVDVFVEWKRLTDAERAAEYWRGEFDYERAFHGMCYLSGNWDPGKFSTYERRAVLERFATLPHYDEPDQ